MPPAPAVPLALRGLPYADSTAGSASLPPVSLRASRPAPPCGHHHPDDAGRRGRRRLAVALCYLELGYDPALDRRARAGEPTLPARGMVLDRRAVGIPSRNPAMERWQPAPTDSACPVLPERVPVLTPVRVSRRCSPRPARGLRVCRRFHFSDRRGRPWSTAPRERWIIRMSTLLDAALQRLSRECRVQLAQAQTRCIGRLCKRQSPSFPAALRAFCERHPDSCTKLS